jgi:hypothetical protein
MLYFDNANLAGFPIDGMPDAVTGSTPQWQLVTGLQGSVTHVVQFSTDIPGFSAASLYEDSLTPGLPQCTGDGVSYGASGAEISGPGGSLPNTDPVAGSANNFTATRVLYYDAPGLAPAGAQQRRDWALNPLTTLNFAWP